MPRRPFMRQVQGAKAVDILTLNQIVACMTRGQYDKVVRLFGAKIRPIPKDDEPVNLDDLPPFDHGK